MIDDEINLLRDQTLNYDVKACSDIGKGIPQPPPQKPVGNSSRTIALERIEIGNAPSKSFYQCTFERCSRRIYSKQPLTLYELSFVLWCTQGIKKVIPGFRKYIPDGSGRNYLMLVPNVTSSFETYIAAINIQGLDPGLYRYLPLTHQLEQIRKDDGIADKMADICRNAMQNQDYVKNAGVVMLWTCVPYRAKWRNKEKYAPGMLISIGHVSQNFYLATEAIGCGCVSISGFMQSKADGYLGINGEDELTLLCSAMGHIDDDQKDVYGRFEDCRMR